MGPFIPLELKQTGIVISPTDWLVVISTKGEREVFPLEKTAVFIGGFAFDPIHLQDALIMFGKSAALANFKRYRHRPVATLVSAWSLLAKKVGRRIFVIEEIDRDDEDSFGMRALYMVTTDGKAGFFLSHDRMHVMQLIC